MMDTKELHYLINFINDSNEFSEKLVAQIKDGPVNQFKVDTLVMQIEALQSDLRYVRDRLVIAKKYAKPKVL